MVESNELDALKLVLDLDEIDLARYQVVGGIVRYDQSARNSMKNTRQKITTSILANNHGRENFQIWAPPREWQELLRTGSRKVAGKLDRVPRTESSEARRTRVSGEVI